MMTSKVQTVSFKVDGDGSPEGTSGGGGGGRGTTPTTTTANPSPSSRPATAKPKSCKTDSAPSSSSPSGPPSSSVVTTRRSGVGTIKWQHILGRIRTLLGNYLKFASTPARQEAILKITQYSLWLASRFYAARGRRAAATAASTGDAATTAGGNNSNSYHTHLAESLLSLSGEISWTRYLLRCFGLPVALEGADSGSWVADSKRLGRTMAWTMVAYYPLENLAYVLWKAPKLPVHHVLPERVLLGSPTRPGQTSAAYDPARFASKASAWSCRFWLAFIVLDVARSVMALQQLQATAAQEAAAENGRNSDSNDDDDGTRTLAATQKKKQAAMVRTERLQLVRNFLYMVQAIQWSLPNWDTQPWLPTDVVNGLCWLESIVGMYQTVRNFQDDR
jgi:hypothetical protein